MVLPIENPTKSYWIEAAKSPLRNFRSNDKVPVETDVVVIGSGYAGVTTAYWIHKYAAGSPKQPSVTLLDARDICGSATGRNGGQLRPHVYSRYPAWSERFGPDGAMKLIEHELAHLQAFKNLCAEEGITEEVCLKYGETFDAAMTDEAWARLKGAYDAMRKDHGGDNEIVKACRLIDNGPEAEDFTQMKGAIAAVVHPTGQVWPYKFVHALLRILLQKGNLNLQAHTPVTEVSPRGPDGSITVKTARGIIKARAVVHTTNRWASHLLPEFSKLILPLRGPVAAIKAPPGLLKRTGAQHWDAVCNNYHLQLPPPYNMIILGGARPVTVHKPETCMINDDEDQQIDGVADYFKSWPDSHVKNWPSSSRAEFGKPDDEGGCWTGGKTSPLLPTQESREADNTAVQTWSADEFPFVGPVPNRDGHYIAAGFSGHGMPRILLSAAHMAPLVLESLGLEHSQPLLASAYPPLPEPFRTTAERIERLQSTDVAAVAEQYKKGCEESAKKPFCDPGRPVPEF